MVRPEKFVPMKTVKGILQLRKEGKTYSEMVDYYKKHGIETSEYIISRRLKELENEER